MKTPPPPAAVEAVFEACPPPVRDRLLMLRRMILETAADTQGVGPLRETLKWGQPAYLTLSGSGSTVRIDQVKAAPGRCAMFFHCQTDLVETFRHLYPGAFTFSGNRALVFDADSEVPAAALRHCIALALTYHQRKR